MEGALEAARDLVSLWIDEKRAHGEPVAAPSEAILATLEGTFLSHSTGFITLTPIRPMTTSSDRVSSETSLSSMPGRSFQP